MLDLLADCHLVEALLLLKKTADLPCVEPSDLDTLRMVCKGRGKSSFLQATEAHTWDKESESDLTSLFSRRKEMDTVSTWVSWFREAVFHKHWGHKTLRPTKIHAAWAPEYSVPLREYSEESSNGFVHILRVILGPVLTMASAICLSSTILSSKWASSSCRALYSQRCKH